MKRMAKIGIVAAIGVLVLAGCESKGETRQSTVKDLIKQEIKEINIHRPIELRRLAYKGCQKFLKRNVDLTNDCKVDLFLRNSKTNDVLRGIYRAKCETPSKTGETVVMSFKGGFLAKTYLNDDEEIYVETEADYFSTETITDCKVED